MGLKTKPTDRSITVYISSFDEPTQIDCLRLVNLFEEATGFNAVLWSNNIIGFGKYHYESDRSSQKGEWFITGFAVRKTGITIYIIPGAMKYDKYLKRLGNYRISGKSCLSVKSLKDIDIDILRDLIRLSAKEMKKKYEVVD